MQVTTHRKPVHRNCAFCGLEVLESEADWIFADGAKFFCDSVHKRLYMNNEKNAVKNQEAK